MGWRGPSSAAHLAAPPAGFCTPSPARTRPCAPLGPVRSRASCARRGLKEPSRKEGASALCLGSRPLQRRPPARVRRHLQPSQLGCPDRHHQGQRPLIYLKREVSALGCLRIDNLLPIIFYPPYLLGTNSQQDGAASSQKGPSLCSVANTINQLPAHRPCGLRVREPRAIPRASPRERP